MKFIKNLGFFQGVALTLCLTSAISIATVTIPGFFTFSPGTPISSSQINSNFDKLSALIDNTRSQNYIGVWTASTNSPDIEISSPVAGDYYIVGTAGSHTFANGDALTFALGDWVIYNGISWEKIQVASGVWATSGADTYFNSGNVGIGITSPTEKLHIVGNANITGKIRFKDSSANFVELNAPTSLGATYGLTFPPNAGSTNQVLTTDGAGILSWSTPSAAASGPAGGSLSGTYPNPTIGTSIITDSHISGSANIAQSKIANLATDLANKEPIITAGTSNQYIRGDKTLGTFSNDVLPVIMTGLSTATNAVISASDTILDALGKLQAQVTGLSSSKLSLTGGTLSIGTINGVPAPVNGDDVVNKSYVDSSNFWTPNGGNIYRSGGNVGIGTSSPAAMLDVVGNARINTVDIGKGGGSGNDNIFVGATAMTSLTTGIQNVAFGNTALMNTTTGGNNTAIGYAAMVANTAGGMNTATGYATLNFNSTGNSNTAFGHTALTANTTGGGNTAIGADALENNKANSESTAIGHHSMYYANDTVSGTITGNTAVGAFSLTGGNTANLNTGTNNTAIGHSALTGVTSGSANTALGSTAGAAITTGTGNVIIGSNNGSSIATQSNNIILADGTGTIRLQVNSAGNMGIGGIPGAYKLEVSGDINSIGMVRASGSVLTSDMRLKKDIKNIDNALERLTSLNGVSYNWNHSFHPELKLGNKPQLGVLAQEVEVVFPQAVYTDKLGLKSVAYNMLIAPIIEAIKEMKAIFFDHDQKLAKLEKENAQMKSYICSTAKDAPAFCSDD